MWKFDRGQESINKIIIFSSIKRIKIIAYADSLYILFLFYHFFIIAQVRAIITVWYVIVPAVDGLENSKKILSGTSLA